VGEFPQNLFHLRHDVNFIGQRYFVPYLWMDDIPRTAEVHHHWYSAAPESFENYACTVVAKRWKHHHVSRAQVPEDFLMAEPAAEENRFLDSKGSRKLLKAVPFRAIADNGKASQIILQKGSSCTQRKVTTLAGNQASDEDQLKFGSWLRTVRVTEAQGVANAGLRDKKQFVAICDEFSVRLR